QTEATRRQRELSLRGSPSKSLSREASHTVLMDKESLYLRYRIVNNRKMSTGQLLGKLFRYECLRMTIA
ncbi:MAG: hypothetical protein ACRDEA_06060, partial [Microcystaceae cyanobacterium]